MSVGAVDGTGAIVRRTLRRLLEPEWRMLLSDDNAG